MKKTRVLLIDDHTVFRQALARALNNEADIELNFHCASVGEALIIIASSVIDVVLLDVDLGPERGIDFLRQARANGFRKPVLLLTAGLSNHEQELPEYEGIAGTLRKDISVEELLSRVRELGPVEDPVPPRPGMHTVPEPTAVRNFERREVEVLRMTIEGHSNKHIAAELGITESTVKTFIQQLYHKTGAHSRSELVSIAFERYPDIL